MKVKFNRDVATKEAKPQKFAKDEVVDFVKLYMDDPDMKALHGDNVEGPARARARASAQHWINRGAAVEVAEHEPRKHHEAATKKG